MAELKTLARPYAEAAFALAREHGQLAGWSKMLQLLAALVSDERIARLVADPRVSSARLLGLLLDIAGDKLDRDGKNFVRVLVENERLVLLPTVAAEFEQLRSAAEGVVEVEAISAFPLSESQLREISQGLKKRLGRELRITARVDPTLIGGVVVRAGDLVIDGSARGRLRDLATQLTH
jgi:F-type H+-transporting ATPase subunit delta